MSSTQRTVAVCLILGLLATVTLLTPNRAVPQPPPPAPAPAPPPLPPGGPFTPGGPTPPGGPEPIKLDPKDPNAFEAALLPRDRADDAKKKLGAAIDRLRGSELDPREIEVACRSLQTILDGPSDVFIYIPQKDKNGKETSVRVSARSEANRLLANLTAKGQEIYQFLYGTQAKARVEEARRRRDPLLLNEVVRRYFYTNSGGEALALLASYHLDRGDPGTAADYFDRLLQRSGGEKLEPLMLLKVAIAFHQANDLKHENEAWKMLATRQNGKPLRLGDKDLPLDLIRKEVDRLANGSSTTHDWTLYRGDARRTGRGQGDAPYLEPRWQAATVELKEVRDLIENAIRSNAESMAPTLPGSFPIAAGGKLICRTAAGVAAFDLRTGERKWQTAMPLGLETCFGPDGIKVGRKAQLNNWIKRYAEQGGALDTFGAGGGPGIPGGPGVPMGGPVPMPGPGGVPPGGMGGSGPIFGGSPYLPSFVYENSVLGTLSTDQKRVYLIEDLPLQPPLQLLQEREGGQNRPLGPFEDALHFNKVVALDLETGAQVWEAGKRSPKGIKDTKDDLKDCFFLGPPLPLFGKLYTTAEKQGEIRLVCLDPQRGELNWVQPLLVLHNNKLPMDVGRRLQPNHLAYADGVLVCPTAGGAVVGVDVLSQSLLWVSIYRERPQAGPDGTIDDTYEEPLPLSTHWKGSAPIIADGKVILSCPDRDAIVCLELRDGKQLWKVNRAEDDLYLAGVFGGKELGEPAAAPGPLRNPNNEARLLIVGKTACRAVSLKDGASTLWHQATGMPSGHGVASGPLYYLPLKSGHLLALDVQKGEVVARTEGRAGAPGNLLAHDGDILSQTAVAVAAYPQLKIKLAQVDELIKKNPHDPVGLTERGELRLYQGNLAGAVADLREARLHQPPADLQPRLRARLFDAMTQLLQKDFSGGEQYLGEYRELCRVDVPAGTGPEERQRLQGEQARRETQLLCLMAHGREQQPDRLQEALASYRDLHAKGTSRLVGNIDDPLVQSRLDVWVESRMLSLFAKAGPQREPLEKQLREEWQKLRNGDDRDGRDRFVALFGGASRMGQEARLDLAELFTADLERGRFLEAERLFQQVRTQTTDRDLTGRALEGLARLALRKGRLHEAADRYRELGRDFATVVIREGKTGADLLAEVSLDRRLLGYIDDGGSPWQLGVHGWEVKNAPARAVPFVFTFEPTGPTPEALRRQVLQYDVVSANLKLIDRQTGVEVWSAKSGIDPSLQRYFREGNVGAGRYPCHVQGRVAVVSLGQTIFAIDLLDRRILWRRMLFEGRFDPQRVYIDPSSQEVGMQLFLMDRSGQGSNRLLGRVGCVGPDYAALQTTAGLVVLDLLRGDTLWTRSDVQPDADLFNDDRHLFLVEGQRVATRALRALDGATVSVPSFVEAYQKHVQRMDGRLLLSENDAEGRPVLQLYDVVTGKELWKHVSPQNTLTVHSEDSGLVAAIEPDGTVRIFDLHLLREVRKAQVERKHFDNSTMIRLVTDRTRFYLLPQQPVKPGARVDGQPFSGAMNMRSVPVNGWVYSFHRSPPKDDQDLDHQDWFNEVENQEMLLEQIDDMPVVLFAAMWNKTTPNGEVQQLLAVQSLEKVTGKRRFRKEFSTNGQGFHALLVDQQALTIDLVGMGVRIRHSQAPPPK